MLFYNTGDEGDLAQIEGLGGIRYQLLTHRRRSGALAEAHQGTVRLPALCCSAPEAPAAGRHAPVDIVFGADDRRLGDIDVLHTPGHTDGSLCFFYRSPHGKSYLLTRSSSLERQVGALVHAQGRRSKALQLVLSKAGGSKAALADSLLQLRELDPDLVLSSGFVGDVAMAAVTRDAWTEAIDSNVRRLKSASQ